MFVVYCMVVTYLRSFCLSVVFVLCCEIFWIVRIHCCSSPFLLVQCISMFLFVVGCLLVCSNVFIAACVFVIAVSVFPEHAFFRRVQFWPCEV